MNASNKKLLNVTKCQGYSLYRSELLRETNRGSKITPPNKIRVKITHIDFDILNNRVTVIYLRFIKSTYFDAVKQEI